MEKTINSLEKRKVRHKAASWVLVNGLTGNSCRPGLGGPSNQDPVKIPGDRSCSLVLPFVFQLGIKIPWDCSRQIKDLLELLDRQGRKGW